MDPFERDLLAALPKLRRVAIRLTRDSDAAADLVQDAIERAWRARESFALGTNMGAWLCFIGRNHFLSRKRRDWRWQQFPVGQNKHGEEVEFIDLLPAPANQHHKLELDDLLEALGYLPAEQRDAILLVGEGLSYDEAAAELGTSEGTIKSRVCRGRDALDAYFGNNIIEEPA